VIAPLGAAFSVPRAARDTLYLETYIPEWGSLAFAACGKYLVLQPGWQVPACCGAPTSPDGTLAAGRLLPPAWPPLLGVALYSSRALPTLGYIAQLYPLADHMLKADHMSIQRISHHMHCALLKNMSYKLKEIGAPQPLSRNVLSYAARLCTANTTATSWRAAKSLPD
jgi:hypothetical protein